MLGWMALVPVHDIHVSNTQIKIANDGGIEIVVRIFYDDLQAAMGLQPGDELPAKYPSADVLIEKYLHSAMKWSVDGKTVKPQYLRSKAAPPAVWAYMKMQNPMAEVREIRLENKLLLDHFDDQVNMVTAELGGQDYHFVMDKKNSIVTFGTKVH